MDWGITFDKTYETEEKSHRKVYYADKEELEENIVRQTLALEIDDDSNADEAISFALVSTTTLSVSNKSQIRFAVGT